MPHVQAGPMWAMNHTCVLLRCWHATEYSLIGLLASGLLSVVGGGALVN